MAGTLAGNSLSVLYLGAFLAVGWLLARRTLPAAGPERTVPLGCAYGVALLAMLPAAFGLLLGFGAADAAVSLLAVLAAGAAAWHGLSRKAPAAPAALQPEDSLLHRRISDTRPRHAEKATALSLPGPAVCRADAGWMLCFCVPGILLTLYLLYTHVLCYDAVSGAYYTGQSGYGDIAMHLAFIKSIAVQGKMPPAYSLLAGQELFGYPFLCESVSSIFLVLGAGLKFAYLLPEIPALISIFCFVWLLAREALCHRGKACAAFTLFFLGGGFGFVRFFESKEAFKSIFTGYYTTPTNDVTHNIRWVNCIADLLVPQRATLMGWALAMPCLYLLYRFALGREKRLWLALGLLAGCLPLMQTHSLLVMVILSAVLLGFAVADTLPKTNVHRQPGGAAQLLPWLGYAAVAGALCLPQLFGVIFRQTDTGQHFLRFIFNWANNGTGENYFWFYIKNLGLIYLVQIPAFFWAKKPLRRWYIAACAVLLISEWIVFQPNSYDNIKLLFFWFLAACLLAANALWDFLARIRMRPVRALLAGCVAFLCTVASVLTLGREVVSKYEVFSADAAAVAEYADENTEADARFLTGQQHLNPVASLAGRNILCGSTLYVYFHGMHYETQQQAVQALYETPNEALLAEWGIDYVLFSSAERGSYAADESFYAARYPVFYHSGEYTIYQITS